ncbi:hypothetical protein EFM10_02635 [Lactobacillus helveticus]|nr:hypothetical protein [Lactobacillus helveticus]
MGISRPSEARSMRTYTQQLKLVVLLCQTLVLEVAVGDNKIKPINPKKGGDRHGNFSHEF